MTNEWWSTTVFGIQIIQSAQKDLFESCRGNKNLHLNLYHLTDNIFYRCRDHGLIQRCTEIQPRKATEEELLKLHTTDRIELLKGTDGSPDAEALEVISSGYDAVYIHPSTYNLSLLAAGSTVELVDAILQEKVQNGMAIIRYNSFLSSQ